MIRRVGAMDSTAILLDRARTGDDSAREILLGRYLPALRRIAHGRLPPRARGMSDTGDLVQATVIRALRRLDQFKPERDGAFMAYLRTILLNQIRDEARRGARRPEHEPVSDQLPAGERGPLEELIGRECLDRYEAALAQLPANHREAVILRLECGFTYDEIAVAISSPTGDAARMLVARTILRIARALRPFHSGPASTRGRRARGRSPRPR